MIGFLVGVLVVVGVACFWFVWQVTRPRPRSVWCQSWRQEFHRQCLVGGCGCPHHWGGVWLLAPQDRYPAAKAFWAQSPRLSNGERLEQLVADGLTDWSWTDLRRLNCAGLDLSGIDLSHSDCTGTRFDGANLRGASFVGAQLTQTSFRGAQLAEVRWE